MNVGKFVRLQRQPLPSSAAPVSEAQPKPSDDNPPVDRAPRTWGLTLGSWPAPPPARRDRR